MNWTKEKPTKPGLYLYRIMSDAKPQPYQVEIDSPYPFTVWIHGKAINGQRLVGEWQGPIVPRIEGAP